MTIRTLRRQHARALRMHKLTRLKGWERAIKRINLEIMKACRK